MMKDPFEDEDDATNVVDLADANKTIFTCDRCGYFRDVSTNRWKRSRKFRHPLYGTVTPYLLAMVDAESHDCVRHRRAVEKAVRIPVTLLLARGRAA
jgi:hypothetical protein